PTRSEPATRPAEITSVASSCDRRARSARARTRARSRADAHAAAAAPPARRTQATARAARSPTSPPSQLPSVSSSNDDRFRGHRSPPRDGTLQRTNKALLGRDRDAVGPVVMAVVVEPVGARVRACEPHRGYLRELAARNALE